MPRRSSRVGLTVDSALLGSAAPAAATAAARRVALPPQEVVLIQGGHSGGVDLVSGTAASRVVRGGGTRVAVDTRRGKWKRKDKNVVVIQQILPDDPLRIANVLMPSEAIEMRDGVCFYAVDIMPEGGSTGSTLWRVMRRYSDFHRLMYTLGSEAWHFPGAPFPGKHFFRLFSCARNEDDRRRALELWLWRAIESPHSAGAWNRPLHNFLEAGRQSVPAGAPAASSGGPRAAQVMPPLPPPDYPPVPSSPPSKADLCTSGEEGEEQGAEELLEIEIPEGVTAGQVLGVSVPNGRQVLLAVPQGLSTGSKLELRYNAQHNTIVPAS